MKSYILTILILTTLFIMVPGLQAFAEDGASGAGYGIGEAQAEAKLPTFGGGGVPAFLGRIAGAGLALAGSLFLFLVIYGGILIMASAGSDTTLKKGKAVITWAIIGAVILGAAYAITSLIFGALTSK